MLGERVTKKGTKMNQIDTERIYDAHLDGEPVMISARQARAVIAAHQQDVAEYEASHAPLAGPVDAWLILSWLGY